MLTESEERKIEEVYEEHNELCTKLQNKAKSSIIYRLFFILPKKEIMKIGKEIEDIIKKIECDGVVAFRVSGGYKFIWGNEAKFTKGYLRYLPMKSKIDETEFRQFLRCPQTNIQLKETDKDKLVEIFRKVKERAKNKEISNEYKLDLTPWEFFKKYFYLWGIRAWIIIERMSGTEKKYEDIKRIRRFYEKSLNIFQELDKAPRISGDLVVELEDILDEFSKDDKLEMHYSIQSNYLYGCKFFYAKMADYCLSRGLVSLDASVFFLCTER